VLENIKKEKRQIGVESAVDSFIKVAGWCDVNRRSGIMHEIGKIGGTASAQRASEQKAGVKKYEQKKAASAQQGTFVFS